MVAKITFPLRLYDAMHYNERKVQNGCAECIGAVNFLREADDMNLNQKLQVLENRNMLNDRARSKTLHVSLNFAPGEKLSTEVLLQIATDYMKHIGFGSQPFVIYQHKDAGHPHLHVVSSTIREDGSRINTHNLGRHESRKARKELEVHYGLVRAEDQRKSLELRPAEARPVIYGLTETKRSISQVAAHIFSHYAYTSLPEFNAALRQYNVLADSGKVKGKIYQHKGLVYRILNEKGEKMGVPIKASSLSCRPTLQNIEGRFEINKRKRAPHKEILKEKIDGCFKYAPSCLQELVDILNKRGVFTWIQKIVKAGCTG